MRCVDRVGTEGRELWSSDREGVGKGVGEAVEEEEGLDEVGGFGEGVGWQEGVGCGVGVFRVGRVRGCEVWVRRARRAGVIRKEYVDLGVGVVRCESSDILGEWNVGVRQGMGKDCE